MSKKVKIVIAIISVGLIGIAAYLLLKPQQKAIPSETELKIEGATVLSAETAVHQDWAGFSFEYPQELIIEEIELNDDSVYSSLEIGKANGEKLTLRISDTQFADLESWQKDFETINVIDTIREIYWANIPGLQLSYGIPKKMLTVAMENGVIYTLESQFDQDDYWDKAQQMVLNSFEFTEEIVQVEPEKTDLDESSEEAEIILLEEIIE